MTTKINPFVGAAAPAAPVRAVVRGKDGETTAASASGSSSRDSVRLTGEGQALAKVERSARESSGIDEAKVADIRRQLADGSYSPNAKAIAGRLVHTEWALSGRT